MKKHLILTVGLPRSGKSTYVRDCGYPIVCPDEVRRYLGCFPFVAEKEADVWKIVRCMVYSLFASGAKTVVLDATNTTMKRRNEWRDADTWIREFWVFHTPVNTCIKRALDGGQDYLIPVIERMANQFEPISTLELAERECVTFY